jgi:hypothetical protein
MPVGLALTGYLHPDHRVKLSEAREWLSRAAVWFETAGDAVLETRLARDADDKPLLHILLHPVADPVELRIGGSGKVTVHARTVPVGPGYHAHLCELLKEFADDFEFAWNEPTPDHDPAHYFATGDRAKLERHFLHWLAAECTAALRKATPAAAVAIGLPRQTTFLHPGPVLTPLGPRPEAWLKEVAADPMKGFDFFPWWSPDLDAEFYTKRALTELWVAFPWRPPLTEAEGEVVDQIAADLANAHEADPAAAKPWGAWAEVVDAIERDANRFTVEPVSAELKQLIRTTANGSRPKLGYRRHDLVATLSGGWHMRMPGRLALKREDDSRTWTAWDDTMTVWFRDQSLGHPERGPLPTPREAIAVARKNLPPGEPVVKLDNGTVGEAVFGPHVEDGKPVWRLCGVAAAGHRLAVCNIYLTREADRDAAVAMWQSLHRVH